MTCWDRIKFLDRVEPKGTYIYFIIVVIFVSLILERQFTRAPQPMHHGVAANLKTPDHNQSKTC